MPVFLVLYQVLRGLTRRVSDLGFGPGWVAGPVRHRASTRRSRRTSTCVRSGLDLNPTRRCTRTCARPRRWRRSAWTCRRAPARRCQPGHRARLALPGAHRHRGRHRLRPAAADPGPQPERHGQPPAADDHEDHADLPAGHLLRSAGRPGPVLRGVQPVPHRPAGVHLPQHLRRQGQRDDVEGHARPREGPGQAGEVRVPRRPHPPSKDKAKGKAIPASSKVAPKGKAPARSSSKATPKAGATKGSRPAPSKTSSRSSKADQGGEAPTKASSGPEPTSGSAGPAEPKPSGGTADGAPSLQPRARKKKR